MRHRVGGRTLNMPSDHRKALYRNLVIELVKHEKITTTEAKAKEVRGIAEKLITLGKDGSIQARQRALKLTDNKATVKKIFDELGPRYEGREGGYIRITKLGFRRGDAALISQLELME